MASQVGFRALTARALRRSPSAWPYVAAPLASIGLAAALMRVWRGDLGIPFTTLGDERFVEMVVKSILDHGWHLENPSLGAPGEQDLRAFPAAAADNLQALALKALGYVLPDAPTVLNVYFLLSFGLVALSAVFALRRLGVSRAVATLCALLFALLPYHFERGIPQVLLAAYFAVPLGAYLALAVAADQPIFARRAGRSRGATAWASGATVVTLLLCLLVASASGSAYYAAFTVILVVAAGALGAAARRTVRPLAAGAAVALVVTLALAVNLAPTLAVYAAGEAETGILRPREDSERFGLKVAQMILPGREHRIEPLARLSRTYEAASPIPSEGSLMRIGPVATAGFLWLLAVAFLTLAEGRARLDSRHRHTAAAVLVCVLVGTVGGFSAYAGYLAPAIRGWDRIAVFIAFFAIVAVALLLDGLRNRLRARPRGRLVFGAVLVLVLGVGLLDQHTRYYIPPYEATAAEHRNDAAFVRAVEARLPMGARVLQLPYVPFPEFPPVHRMADYSHLRGYLHSDRLHWSYGGLKGTAQDWQAGPEGRPLADQVRAAAEAGFGGVYVDRFGYADNGRGVETALRSLLRREPLASPDGRLLFFELRERGT